MTPAAIILVTGVRDLADRPEAAEWARAILRSAILVNPSPVVLTGDRRGPEDWACEIADPRKVVRYLRDGAVMVGGSRSGWWIKPPHPPPTPHPGEGWKLRMDARDRALVTLASSRRDNGPSVRVIALRASWSRSADTDCTVRHARAAGLDVTLLTYSQVTP